MQRGENYIFAFPKPYFDIRTGSVVCVRDKYKMHLMYILDASGKRVYTLRKIQAGEVTKSAHPARFSPDDKYSRHRVTLKKRYALLITQQSRQTILYVWDRPDSKSENEKALGQ